MVTFPITLVVAKMAFQEPTIAHVEQKLTLARAASKAEDKSKLFAEAQTMLEELIRSDKLVSGPDFRTAALSFEVPNRFYEGQRVRYELMLTAVKLGDSEARKTLPAAWDQLLISLGRNLRFGFSNVPRTSNSGLYEVRSAPKGVTQFWKSVEAAMSKAMTTKDSKQIGTIMEADQKVREQNWSKLKPKDFEEIAKGDALRLAQIKKIVAQGGLSTATDYFNAALVCQHGGQFEDYALAHELSVCAMILGEKSAGWLAAASYDRMLLNMGHRQRFGTQSYMTNGKMFFSPIDEAMMTETTRFTVGRVKLSDVPYARG